MKNIIFLCALSFFCHEAFSQKIKERKEFVGGKFKVASKVNLPNDVNNYRVRVETPDMELDPSVASEVKNAFVQLPGHLVEYEREPELLIELAIQKPIYNCIREYEAGNLASKIISIDLKAHISVVDANGNSLVDSSFPLLFDINGSITNELTPSQITVDFLLLKKLKSMSAEEACQELIPKLRSSLLYSESDLYKSIASQAGDTLASYFMGKFIDISGGLYGFKKMDALTEAAEQAADHINGLQAISKKNKRSADEVKRSLIEIIPIWYNALEKAESNELKDYLHYNIAFASLFTGDVTAASQHINKIKTKPNRIVMSGSFEDDIINLKEYLKLYEIYGSKLKIDDNI